MERYGIAVKTTLAAKAKPQTVLFQLKILNPSRIPIGIKLNKAMNPFRSAAKKNKT